MQIIGTVIIVANEGSTIDIPPGSILENVVVQGSLRYVRIAPVASDSMLILISDFLSIKFAYACKHLSCMHMTDLAFNGSDSSLSENRNLVYLVP